MKRRDFLKASLATGGAFMLGIQFSGCTGVDARRMRDAFEELGVFKPNAFLTVTPDNRVLVAVAQTEMGQGVFTSHAMLVAEELEVELDRIEAFHPQAGADFEFFGVQMTGGSMSVAMTFMPIRQGAAAAREMFISAAAEVWSSPREQCRAEAGAVVHDSGKKLSYGELTREAARQKVPKKVALKTPDQFRVLGKTQRRVDGLAKVTGRAQYGIDVVVEGMVKALVIRPPVLGSKVRSLDASRALMMPGVVAVFAFEQGVAVVAEKYWIAQRASKLVDVQWEPGVLSSFNTSDLARAARDRIEEPGLNVHNRGNAARAFETPGATIVEATYEAPYLAHAPLEPMNATAWVQEGRCEIWAPVQWQSAVRGDVAHLLGISKEDVHVHTEMPGGGFGRRLMIDYVIEAVLVSREIGLPVQVIWSREDDTRGGYYRPYSLTRMKGALDGEGRPIGLYYHNMSQSLLDLRDWLPGMLPGWLPRVTKMMMARTAANAVDSDTLPNVLATEGALDTTYDIEHIRVEHTQIRVDVPVTFWRAVGHSYNGFVMESFIDELAHAARRDPYEFRRQLLVKDPRKLAVLDKAARLGRWGEPIDKGWGRGIAVHRSFGTYCAQVIEAGVFEGKIEVRRVACVVDCGIALNPDIVKAQMESGILQGLSAAIMQKIEFVDGEVPQGNFDSFPMVRFHESPEIVVEIVESLSDPKGVGEPGLPPAAAALAGAIFAATGRRLRSMPFNDALKEIEQAQREGESR